MDKNIIDISMSIKPNMPDYKNAPPVKFDIHEFDEHASISKFSMGAHTGTHIDAPKHLNEMGLPVDRIDLDSLLGPCRVLNLTHVDISVSAQDLKQLNVQKGERILLKTKNSLRGFTEFYDDYVFLQGAAAKYLAERELLMVGIDAPSVRDKSHDDDNSAHLELLKHGIPIFEGLDLSKGKPGRYIFFGLPIKLEGLDGAPARCVLIPN